MTGEHHSSGHPPDPRLFEESLEELYENAPCGYLSTLPDGTIVKVNETFLSWTGHRRDDIVGRKRFAELLTAGGRIYHETHYAPLLRMQGAVREIAIEVVTADGRRLPVLVNSTLKRDAAGTPLLVRTTIFDASDRKEYERELLRVRDRERVARERTERLQHITAVLGRALLPEEIGSLILPELAAGVGVARAVLAIHDEDEDRLDIISSRGVATDAQGAWEARANQSTSPARVALSSRDPFFSGPRDGQPDGDEISDDLTALAVLPLVVTSGPLGVLWLGFTDGREFSEADRAFLLACAAQCAQALERSQLHARTAEAARRAAFHARASRALDEVQGFRERAQRLVDLLVADVSDEAWIELREGSERTLVAAAGRDVTPPEQELPARREPTKEASAEAVADRALRRGEPAVIAESRVGRTRRDASRTGVRSYAALPLRSRGRILGVLMLARAGSETRFRTTDLPFLGELGERAGLALENARLYEQERDVAHALQQSLLAGAAPQDPRFDVATLYRPGIETLEVGGDWYDTFFTSADRIGIVVGDVVGRGVGAASAMGQLRSAIRALATAGLGPAETLDRLDRFVEQTETGRWATVIYAEVDLETGGATFASAGHPPPLALDPGSPPRFLWEGRSPPLGVDAGAAIRAEAHIVLPPGARLLLYTDGLVERRSVPLDHGLDRLADELGRRRSAPLPELSQELTDAMLVGEQYRDDVCLLCLAFLGTETAAGGTPEQEVVRSPKLAPPTQALRAPSVS